MCDKLTSQLPERSLSHYDVHKNADTLGRTSTRASTISRPGGMMMGIRLDPGTRQEACQEARLDEDEGLVHYSTKKLQPITAQPKAGCKAEYGEDGKASFFKPRS